MINSLTIMAKALTLGLSIQAGAGSDLGISTDQAYQVGGEIIQFSDYCIEGYRDEEQRRVKGYEFAKTFTKWVVGENLDERRLLLESMKSHQRPLFVAGQCKKIYKTMQLVEGAK